MSRAGGAGGKGIAYGGIPMKGIGGNTNGAPGINGTAVVFAAFKVEAVEKNRLWINSHHNFSV